jgi:hypothetical protein
MGIAFGPDGDLYVACGGDQPKEPDIAGGGVFRYDGRTGAVKPKFIEFGDGARGVRYPSKITFGPDGNAYMFESLGGVVRFNGRTGERISSFAPRGIDMTFGPDGRFYLLNGATVTRFDLNTGAQIDTFINASSGELRRPADLTFGPDGDLYIAEGGLFEIKRFDGNSGAYKGVFFISPGEPIYDHINGIDFAPNRLAISHTPAGPQLKFPNTFGYFRLEQRNALDPAAEWNPVTQTPNQTTAGFTLNLSPEAPQQFFRLIRQ